MNNDLGKVGVVVCGGFPQVSWGLGAGEKLLEWLEQNNISLDYIVAVSSGCIPAIAMACGKDEVKRMKKVICNSIKPSDIIEWQIAKLLWKNMSFIYTNEPLKKTLEKQINLDLLFSETAIPLEVVTTTFSHNDGGKTKYHSNKDIFNKRDFLTEVADSMAQIPFLAPQLVSGHGLLGDGAYTNPFPIERAIDMGCDTVFVIDIHGHRWIYNNPKNWIDLLILAFHASVNQIYIMVHDWVGRVNWYIERFESMKQAIGATISNEEEKKTVMEQLDKGRLELFGRVRPIKRHFITGDMDIDLKYNKFTSEDMQNLCSRGAESAQKYLSAIQL